MILLLVSNMEFIELIHTKINRALVEPNISNFFGWISIDFARFYDMHEIFYACYYTLT